MSSVLDLLYSVVVLLVAVGGIAGVYRIGWNERRNAQTPWGLVLAGIVALFVAAMVLSMVVG
ncbi:hypothetical protein ACFQPA_15145 [Halomarina halobia]|uniref:Uncharacterized protein n=1 Tax=Halomarina halobia TaxID=3033386 RepID=A0ABD6A9B1_9EURY|nr:hypothetical protein [Halomarina sp. PSR21]